MKSRREELKRRVQAAPKTPWGARRYGAELKREVTEYGRERQKEGATIAAIAEELGLSGDSLKKWMRWAAVLIAAGKVPFEDSQRGPSRAPGNPQREARSGSEYQQEESAEKRREVPPASSEENLLLFLVKLSDVKLERATREQLCAWLRTDSREGRRRD
jgi:transposase-like protein